MRKKEEIVKATEGFGAEAVREGVGEVVTWLCYMAPVVLEVLCDIRDQLAASGREPQLRNGLRRAAVALREHGRIYDDKDADTEADVADNLASAE